MKTAAVRSLFLIVLTCVAGASGAAQKYPIDEATRSGIIATLKQKISEEYVFPDKAKLIVDRLSDKERRGAYRGLNDLSQLGAALTEDLRQPTSDLHLTVRTTTEVLPANEEGPHRTPEMDRIMLERFKASNFGVKKVDTLPGNIGYLDLREFAAIEFAEPTLGAAMTQLADTDALIVDLRHNGGGDPHTVAFVTSYLFDGRTHLNDMYWRKSGSTDAFWTRDEVPGKRFGGAKKVYVLTSKRTFSGAEEFSYNLKQLKRATIIGETTRGGAHPGGGHRLHPHMFVFIPSGRAINPISKTSWEGTGVTPDIKVAADDALRTAQRVALQELLKQSPATGASEVRRKRLQELGG